MSLCKVTLSMESSVVFFCERNREEKTHELIQIGRELFEIYFKR